MLGNATAVESSPAQRTRYASFPVRPLRLDSQDVAEPKLLRRFSRDLCRGMVVVVLLHLFVLQISVVRGHSMMPSLCDGDRLVVDRISSIAVRFRRCCCSH